MSKSKKRLFKKSFSKLEWVACKNNIIIGMKQSMTNHLGMEGSEFIGRERELLIHKSGRKVHI